MSAQQTDLFAAPAISEPTADLAPIRARLAATLALVQAAPRMPWTDLLHIIREENVFRWDADRLSKEEGDALWAAFDTEMVRLYNILDDEREAAGLA